MDCPDDQQLLDLALNRLSARERAVLLEHVEVCQDCRVELVALLKQRSSANRRSEGPDARSVRLEPGDRLAGYEITAWLGGGASAEVFSAVATNGTLPLQVAIKVFFPIMVGPSQGRVDLEIEIGKRLVGEHVCRLLEAGEVSGHRYLVLELASSSLRHELEHDWGRKTLGDRLTTALAVARGLAVVHGAGLVHRDVKPGNVLRMPDGRLVISDFGLTVPNPELRSQVTVDVGTRSYMAPEVSAGEVATVASDLFSLGCVLHEIFFGTPPRRQPDTGELAWPASADRLIVEREIFALCDLCLQVPSEARPGSAAAVVRQLEEIWSRATGGGTTIVPSGHRAHGAGWARARWSAASVAVPADRDSARTPVMAWFDRGQRLALLWGASSDLHLRVYDADRRLWSNDRLIVARGNPKHPQLAIDDRGHGTVVWSEPEDGPFRGIWVSESSDLLHWSAPQQLFGLSRQNEAALLAVAGSGAARVVWTTRERREGELNHEWSGLYTANRTAGGSWQPAERLLFDKTDASGHSARLALDGEGNGFLTYCTPYARTPDEQPAGEKGSIWVVPVRRGELTRGHQPLDTAVYAGAADRNDHAGAPALACNRAGAAVLAWSRGGPLAPGIWVSRYESSTGWRPAERLTTRGTGPQAAIDRSGSVTVAWTCQLRNHRWAVLAAHARAGEPFGAPVMLDGAASDFSSIALAAAEEWVHAAWYQDSPTGGRMLAVRTLLPGGEWDAPARLGDPNGPTVAGFTLASSAHAAIAFLYATVVGGTPARGDLELGTLISFHLNDRAPASSS